MRLKVATHDMHESDAPTSTGSLGPVAFWRGIGGETTAGTVLLSAEDSA